MRNSKSNTPNPFSTKLIEAGVTYINSADTAEADKAAFLKLIDSSPIDLVNIETAYGEAQLDTLADAWLDDNHSGAVSFINDKGNSGKKVFNGTKLTKTKLQTSRRSRKRRVKADIIKHLLRGDKQRADKVTKSAFEKIVGLTYPQLHALKEVVAPTQPQVTLREMISTMLEHCRASDPKAKLAFINAEKKANSGNDKPKPPKPPKSISLLAK